ncbi:CHC2 zinc finger domain-containing protein [Variovorax atrisoli]|uniref:CHC2 zinc finger domain-containing protein n=1 Tax=Variovorax atrisoli TaxID=3394203 RepID=UPI001427AF9D|nr:CHC2 zinc finger domain-containing protein [Variovorax paradoxus]
MPTQLSDQTLARLRELPMAEVAAAMGIILRGSKAMCFNGHDTASPSFTVSKTRNTWKCFGCGEHGDAIALVRKIHGLGFIDACNWLCSHFGVAGSDVPPSRLARSIARPTKPQSVVPSTSVPSNRPDPELYGWLTAHCGPVKASLGINYLQAHGISPELALKFGIVELVNPTKAYLKLEKHWGAERIRAAGLSGSRRALSWYGYALLFPFKSGAATEYLQVRCLESSMKFFGPSGIPKPMFNRERLRQLRKGGLLHICEGVPDAVAMEGAGFAAVAVLGATSFRSEWVEELLPFDLVGVPDGDTAGEKFMKCLANEFRARSKSVRFAIPPEGMDASDVIARGKNA